MLLAVGGAVQVQGGARFGRREQPPQDPRLSRSPRCLGSLLRVDVRDDQGPFLDRVRGRVTVNWIGKQTPLHCTSNGKVLLAHLSQSRRESILAAPLKRFTPRTITDRRTLERQLKRVEEEGFAFTLEELELGLNAVAAPVRSADLRVSAAVSLSGPSYRVSPQRLPELGQMVREAGEAISRRLGYAEPAPARSEEERRRG